MTPSSLTFLENECLTKAGAANVRHCLITFGRIRGRPYPFISEQVGLSLFFKERPQGRPWGWLGDRDGLDPGLAWHLLSPPLIATMASGSFVTCGGFG